MRGTRPQKVQLLDVPYVPQSGALCGGAALAMVLRYWGMTGVLAEDFAALVEPGQAGIRTGDLVKAVEDLRLDRASLAGNAGRGREPPGPGPSGHRADPGGLGLVSLRGSRGLGQRVGDPP